MSSSIYHTFPLVWLSGELNTASAYAFFFFCSHSSTPRTLYLIYYSWLPHKPQSFPFATRLLSIFFLFILSITITIRKNCEKVAKVFASFYRSSFFSLASSIFLFILLLPFSFLFFSGKSKAVINLTTFLLPFAAPVAADKMLFLKKIVHGTLIAFKAAKERSYK